MPTTIEKRSYDGRYLWFLWNNPTANSSVMNNSGNVYKMARVNISDNLNSLTNKPDSTYPDYPWDNGSNEVYSITNAQSVGKRLADWFQHQGLFRGKGHAYDGTYGGMIVLQNFGRDVGNPENRLFTVTEDLVDDALATSDFSNYFDLLNKDDLISYRSENVKHTCGFSSQATTNATTNRTINGKTILGLSNFIIEVLSSMKSECDSRSPQLCYPLFLDNDTEPHVIGSWGWVGSSNPTASQVIEQGFSVFDDGYASAKWRSAINDARYSTETWYEEWDGSSWQGKTLQQAYVAANSPAFQTTASPLSNGGNTDWYRKMQPFFDKNADYIFNKIVFQPAKTIFKDMRCTNYGIFFSVALPSDPSKLTYENLNRWFFTPGLTFTAKRHIHADQMSPVEYGSVIRDYIPGLFDIARYDVSNYNPNYDAQFAINPNTVTGHRFGSTQSDIYRNKAKQNIRSCFANDNPIPVHPWVEPPGTGVTDRPWRYVHISSVDDVLDIIKDNYLQGVRVWNFFNSPQYPQSEKNFVELQKQFESWLDDLNKESRTIYP